MRLLIRLQIWSVNMRRWRSRSVRSQRPCVLKAEEAVNWKRRNKDSQKQIDEKTLLLSRKKQTGKPILWNFQKYN